MASNTVTIQISFNISIPIVIRKSYKIEATSVLEGLLSGETPVFQYSSDKQAWLDMPTSVLVSGDLSKGTWSSQINDDLLPNEHYFRATLTRSSIFYSSEITDKILYISPINPTVGLNQTQPLIVHGINSPIWTVRKEV